jgi:hypothetical protein
VSGSNEQRSRRLNNETQGLYQITEVVEWRNQRKQKEDREREKEKSELRGLCPGEGGARDVDPAVQERNVEQLYEKP